MNNCPDTEVIYKNPYERVSPPGRGSILPVLTILVVGIVLYANTLHVPFTLDDFDNIVNNRAIQLKKIDLQAIQSVANESFLSKRSFANLSFAVNYYIHGFDLPGYHMVNIFIHIICGILFFYFSYYTLLLSKELKKRPENLNTKKINI